MKYNFIFAVLRNSYFWLHNYARESNIAPIVSHKSREQTAAPVYPIYEYYLRFIFNFRNLVDLLTILPYWATIRKDTNQGATFMRAFRLVRLFRWSLERFHRLQAMLEHGIKTVTEAAVPLAVLLFFLVVYIILFANFVFLAEGGVFMVTTMYPQGAYMRPTATGMGMAISTFDSIPSCVYWSFLTITTGRFLVFEIRLAVCSRSHMRYLRNALVGY